MCFIVEYSKFIKLLYLYSAFSINISVNSTNQNPNTEIKFNNNILKIINNNPIFARILKNN